MDMRVTEYLQGKFTEIQGRVPVRLAGFGKSGRSAEAGGAESAGAASAASAANGSSGANGAVSGSQAVYGANGAVSGSQAAYGANQALAATPLAAVQVANAAAAGAATTYADAIASAAVSALSGSNASSGAADGAGASLGIGTAAPSFEERLAKSMMAQAQAAPPALGAQLLDRAQLTNSPQPPSGAWAAGSEAREGSRPIMETVIFPNILRASEPEPIQDQAQALGIGGGPDLMQAADYEPAEALSYAGGLEYAPTYGGGAVGGDAAAYGGAYYGSPASQPQPALQASMHSTPPQTPIGALEGDSGIDANIEYLNRYGDAEVRATISDAISRASIEHGVDANLIKAVIAQESAFSPTSLSSAGAQGLMQLMPDTADYLGVANPWDINQNIDGGTRLLSSYIDTYGGDLQLVLAAYNAGPGAVGKYGGVPPYSETKDYVRKVSAYYDKYRSEL